MRLKLIKAGLLDTAQDTGRWGYQHLGINPGGVMDRFSASLANALLGKESNAPVIEMHFPAASISLDEPCIICLSGADFTPSVNDVPVPLLQPLLISADAILKFKAVVKGARCYLASLNDLQLQNWMGSYSTNLKAAAGGYRGRKLEKGDELNFSSLKKSFAFHEAFMPLPWRYNEASINTNEIEFISGREWDWLDRKSQTLFLNNHFKITLESDRMGYRLQGEALRQNANESLVSSAVSFGTIQLLPKGQLIVLMADHQTTGGYPRIGHVIRAHLPTLAQMKPGGELKFAMTDVDSAEEKYCAQQEHLSRLQNTCNLKMQNWLHAH